METMDHKGGRSSFLNVELQELASEGSRSPVGMDWIASSCYKQSLTREIGGAKQKKWQLAQRLLRRRLLQTAMVQTTVELLIATM